MWDGALEAQRPFERWRDSQRACPPQAPPPELGRGLESLEDVSVWLSHPSNWFRGETYILKWNGSVPTISESHVWQLAPGSFCRDMMLRVVLHEHQRRRNGGFREDIREHDVCRGEAGEVPDV